MDTVPNVKVSLLKYEHGSNAEVEVSTECNVNTKEVLLSTVTEYLYRKGKV